MAFLIDLLLGSVRSPGLDTVRALDDLCYISSEKASGRHPQHRRSQAEAAPPTIAV